MTSDDKEIACGTGREPGDRMDEGDGPCQRSITSPRAGVKGIRRRVHSGRPSRNTSKESTLPSAGSGTETSRGGARRRSRE